MYIPYNYVEFFVGILFCEIMALLSFHFRELRVCLVLTFSDQIFAGFIVANADEFAKYAKINPPRKFQSIYGTISPQFMWYHNTR